MGRDVVRYPKSHSGRAGTCSLPCRGKGQRSVDVFGYRAGCLFVYFCTLIIYVLVKKIAPAGAAPCMGVLPLGRGVIQHGADDGARVVIISICDP